MKIKNNKDASIIVLSLILVWFLLVLSVWIMRVILAEANDTYWMKNSLKAFYWAESSLELALLKLKLKWFGYNTNLDKKTSWESAVLVKDITKYKRNLDPLLSYKIDSIAETITWSIEAWNSQIFQLFYRTGSTDFSNNSTKISVSDIELKVTPEDKFVWSIISKNKSLNGTWGITWGKKWFWKYSEEVGEKREIVFFESWTTEFLANNTGAYLKIQNFNSTGSINYKISWSWNQTKITWKYTTILASAKVGKYMQNIEMKIDNSEYLNIILYALRGGFISTK